MNLKTLTQAHLWSWYFLISCLMKASDVGVLEQPLLWGVKGYAGITSNSLASSAVLGAWGGKVGLTALLYETIAPRFELFLQAEYQTQLESFASAGRYDCDAQRHELCEGGLAGRIALTDSIVSFGAFWHKPRSFSVLKNRVTRYSICPRGLYLQLFQPKIGLNIDGQLDNWWHTVDPDGSARFERLPMASFNLELKFWQQDDKGNAQSNHTTDPSSLFQLGAQLLKSLFSGLGGIVLEGYRVTEFKTREMTLQSALNGGVFIHIIDRAFPIKLLIECNLLTALTQKVTLTSVSKLGGMLSYKLYIPKPTPKLGSQTAVSRRIFHAEMFQVRSLPGYRDPRTEAVFGKDPWAGLCFEPEVEAKLSEILEDVKQQKPIRVVGHGPPGTGKSASVGRIVKAAEEGGAIIYYCHPSQFIDPENPAESLRRLKMFMREIQLRAKLGAYILLVFDEGEALIEKSILDAYKTQKAQAGSQDPADWLGFMKQTAAELIAYTSDKVAGDQRAKNDYLLGLLSGAQYSPEMENVGILITTNYPDRIDQRFLRGGGRFVALHVGYPSVSTLQRQANNHLRRSERLEKVTCPQGQLTSYPSLCENISSVLVDSLVQKFYRVTEKTNPQLSIDLKLQKKRYDTYVKDSNQAKKNTLAHELFVGSDINTIVNELTTYLIPKWTLASFELSSIVEGAVVDEQRQRIQQAIQQFVAEDQRLPRDNKM